MVIKLFFYQNIFQQQHHLYPPIQNDLIYLFHLLNDFFFLQKMISLPDQFHSHFPYQNHNIFTFYSIFPTINNKYFFSWYIFYHYTINFYLYHLCNHYYNYFHHKNQFFNFNHPNPPHYYYFHYLHPHKLILILFFVD